MVPHLVSVRAWTLAIDFGTTATVAAVQIDGDRPEILEIGGERRLPSIVFIDDDGSIVVGHAAAGLAISRPDRAIRAPKGRLGEQVPVVLAGEAHQAVDLVSAVLASVSAEAERFVGSPPTRTRLTYPATWNRPRRSRLLEAAAKAGLPEPELIAEPVAAALTYSERANLPNDRHVAVYDLGGGTFDTAVLRTTSGGFRVVGRPHGDPQLGGELFDEMLMNLVGERLDEDRWDELIISEEPAWRRAAARLRRECKRVKESLSTHGYGEVVMGLPDGMIEERVTKEELEELVRPFIDESVSLLGQCIDDAGVASADLDAIYITGGASRMPMVEEAVRAAYPDVAVSRQGDPKTAVAFGALVASPASMDASLAAAPDRTTLGDEGKRSIPPTPSQDLRTPSADVRTPPTPSQDLRTPPVPGPAHPPRPAATPPTPPPSEISIDRQAPTPPTPAPATPAPSRPAASTPTPPTPAVPPTPTSPAQAQPQPRAQAQPQAFAAATAPPAQPSPAQQSPARQPTQQPAGQSNDRPWTSNPLVLAAVGFLVVLVLGGALVAAALAGGNDDEGSQPTVRDESTTTSSTATTTTENSSDGTTTDTQSDTGLSGPTLGDLDRALLIAADVPAEWSLGTLSDGDGTFCDTDPLLPPQIETAVTFDNATQESILHQVQSYDSEATAISVFSFDRQTVEGCPTSQVVQDGLTFDVAASVVEVADVGDESVGFRLILTNTANTSVQVHIQFGEVRHGRTISSFAVTTLGEPTAAQLLLFDETFQLASNRVIDNVPR